MKISCRYCGKIHDKRQPCEKKPKRQKYNFNKHKTEFDKFRWTKEWQETRERIKERDRHLCQFCLTMGVLNYKGVEVHHIESLNDHYELRTEPSNLITLCSTCHRRADWGEIDKYTLKRILSQKSSQIPPGAAE